MNHVDSKKLETKITIQGKRIEHILKDLECFLENFEVEK